MYDYDFKLPFGCTSFFENCQTLSSTCPLAYDQSLSSSDVLLISSCAEK